MIQYFKNESSDNVINKTLTLINTEQIKLKKTVDITNPIIELTLTDLNFNYVFIDELNRYYFVRSIESLGNGTFTVYLECDVLETYKDMILTSECEYTKELSDGDYQSISSNSEVRKEVEIFKSDVTLTRNNDEYIISVYNGGY